MPEPDALLECRRLELVARLDSQKSSAERNRWGQFATPPALADQIVRAALQYMPQDQTFRYLEPGLGSGSFFSAIRQATNRIRFAKGIELDPLFISHAKQLWKGTGLRVVEGSFTDMAAPASESAKYDLVVSNPPYVRHHHIEPANKKGIQARIANQTKLRISGLAGLYAHFMLLSKAWMSQGGLGVWLVPAEFMSVNYGSALRQFLLEQVTLLRIHRFDPNDGQFDDAMVTSVVVFFRNTPPPGDHQIEFSQGGTVPSPTRIRTVRATQLCSERKWPINHTAPTSNGTGTMLSDLFSIRRGIATGCNRFFVLDKQRVRESKLPGEFLRPILPSPRELKTDIVTADRLGVPSIRNPKFLLSCSLDRRQAGDKSAALGRYLDEGERLGIHNRYLCRNRRCWYQQEDREPALFLCTYMGRHTQHRPTPFRFIWNQSHAIAANVYLMLYPHPPFANFLNADRKLQEKLFQSLNRIASEAMVGEGRVYGGGLHKVEPKELGKVRLAGFDRYSQ